MSDESNDKVVSEHAIASKGSRSDDSIVIDSYIQIDPDMNLQEFILEYPQLVDFLAEDYGFHCVTCMFSGWDTLREGASIHQIEGADFDEMIKRLETILNSEESVD
jgi:hybrid cluster-associated redox disulfide protein